MNRPLEPLEDPELLATPPGYRARSAEDKADWLWNELIAGSAHTPAAMPPLRLPFQARPLAEIGVVTRRAELDKALSRTDDLMEAGRPKVIHARGTVALVELVTEEASPFTGLLGPPPQGGAIGLVRLSLVAKVVGKAAVTPGMGLKFLIDGGPSADLLAMNHVVGQGRDFDLFSNTMTNDLSEAHDDIRPPQKVMGRLFRRVSERPRRLEVTHLTGQRRDGSAVDEAVVPRRLVFHPTDEARRIFVGQAGIDFRRVLADVDAGTTLFEVEGLTGPPPGRDTNGRPRRGTGESVGTIRTTTAFVSSEGGDRLYFRHVQSDADRKV